MEIASGITIETVKLATTPLLRHIGYFVHYKRKLAKLLRKVEDVQNTRVDLQKRVDAARRNLESIRIVVETWLEKVDVEIIRIMGLVDDESAQIRGDGCYKVCRCSCRARYSIGKEAQEKMVVIDELLIEGRSFSDVSDPLSSIEVAEPTTRNIGFQDFPSREFTRKGIMKALKDGGSYVIGLYGMGGIGKTTLMKQVGKHLEEEGVFDVVVMTTVSQNLNLKRIQGEIAKKLGLHRLEQEDDLCTRAVLLSKRLRQEEKILIILDDVWTTELDLSTIGVPCGEKYLKGCKIVITTRRLDVCSSMMAQTFIEVGVLSEEDSWHLFSKSVGMAVDSSSTMQRTAREIAKECGGLPVALVTLGKALRNKRVTVWNDTLLQLRSNDFTLIEGMDSKVSSSIQLSYNYLGNTIIQKCFLFCCLFPEDEKITMDELMMYMMGDPELLENVITLKEARGRLHTVVDKLIASCLLLGKMDEEIDEYYVWMHDVVRDVAISIASCKAEDNACFFVKAGVGLRHCPQMGSLSERCKHVSLMRNAISVLPEQLELPHLLTLSLEGNEGLKEIPDRFLKSLGSLATLNIRRTNISSLPLSISCLQNLRVFHLDYCLSKSIDVCAIGKLKMLEILSLQDCGLKKLPKEIGELTNLRLLNLSKNPSLVCIPPKVISCLSRLEELYMWDSFRMWDIEANGDGCNASLVEVTSLLNCLTTLHMDVDSHPHLRLGVSIGRGRNTWSKRDLRCGNLYFECYLTASPPFHCSVNSLLEKVGSLLLNNCIGLRSMGDAFIAGVNNLKSLCVTECIQMEYVMSTVEGGLPTVPFINLEELHLHGLCNLRKIVHGPVRLSFLGKLRILKVEECYSLGSIFSFSMSTRLQNLEVLHVCYCDKLEYIFQEEAFDTSSVLFFPNLRDLKIRNCPILKHIFPSVRLLHSGLKQLQTLQVKNCNSLKEMINIDHEDKKGGEQGGIILPQLRELDIDNLPSLTTIWKSGITIESFPSLAKLKVRNCHLLKHLLPSMKLVYGGGCLSQLLQLEIRQCEIMEEIFNDEDEVHYDGIVLGQLRNLMLVSLPNLKTITRGFILFGNLRELVVDNCDTINYIFPMRLLLHGGLMKLETLKIGSCNNMEVIINGEQGHHDDEEDNIERLVLLPQLKVLYLEGLPELSNFFQHGQLDWPSIEWQTVLNCRNLAGLSLKHQSVFKLSKLAGEKDGLKGWNGKVSKLSSHTYTS